MRRVINPSTYIEPEVVKKWIHMPGTTSLDFDHNTSRVVASSTHSMICVFNIDPRKRTLFLAGHEDTVHDVRFNSDGSLIASGGEDTFAKVFQSPTDATAGKPVSTKYNFHFGAVRSVDFNSDSSTLLTACNDKIVRLISVETNQAVVNFLKHSACVRSARFSQSSEFLVSGGEDGYIYVWDARVKRPINQYEMKGHVVSVAADNRNRLIASASSKAACVYEMRTNRRVQNCLAGINKPIVSVHFHPEKPLVIMGCTNGTILVSNMFAGNPLFEMTSLIGEMSAAKFSRCGEYFAVCGRDPMAQVSLWVVKKQKKSTYIREPVKTSRLISQSSKPRINHSLQRLQPSDRVRSLSDDTLANKHKSFAQVKNTIRKQSLRRQRMENLILLRGRQVLDAAERKEGSAPRETYLELLLSRSYANEGTGSIARRHSSLNDLRHCVPGMIEEECESQVALEEKIYVSDLNERKADKLIFSDSHAHKDVVNMHNSTLRDVSVSCDETKKPVEESLSDIKKGAELSECEKLFNVKFLSLKEVPLKIFDKKDTDDSSSSATSVDAAESTSSSDDHYELASDTFLYNKDDSVDNVNMADEKTASEQNVLPTGYNMFMQDAVRGIPGLMAPDEVVLDPREREQRVQQVLQVALENAKNEGCAAALLKGQVTEMLKISVSGFEAFRAQAEGVICMHDYIMLQLKDDIADDRVPLESLKGFRDGLIKMCEYLQSSNKEIKGLIFELGHQYMKFKQDKMEMM